MDVLSLLADRTAPRARSGAAAVLRVLLHEFGNDPAFARRVKDHVDDPLAQGPADHDLSVRVPSHIMIAVDDMAERVGIGTRSEVFRGVPATAKEEVLDGGDAGLTERVARALAAVA